VIDVNTETLLEPRQALKHPALRARDGGDGHIAKLHRLFQKGVKAADGTCLHLEYVRCPSGKKTSVEAIARFVERLTLGAGAARPGAMTTAAVRRQQQRADAELDRLGIK
jgi:hypothetical protein